MQNEGSSTPPLSDEAFEDAKNDTLPDKSKDRYERIYNEFAQWRSSNNMEQYSERVVLAYVKELSKRYNPGSIWTLLSMLKTTLKLKHNVDIYKYHNVMAYVKKFGDGYTSKKSEVFTSDQIKKFLREADDQTHLLSKVVLVIGISGCCRKYELLNIRTTDIEDLKTKLLINLVDTRTKQARAFIVTSTYYPYVKKYWKLRPANTLNPRFFINYQRGKCTKQVVGINKLGAIPRKIAEFLKLPNAAKYTGHSLRRTSASILVDSGADIMQIKRHGGWRSTNVAESYIADSMRSKGEVTEPTSSAIQDESAGPSTSSHQEEEPTNNDGVQGLIETIKQEDMEINGPSISRNQDEPSNTIGLPELIENIKQEDVETPSTSRHQEEIPNTIRHQNKEPTNTIELQEVIAKTQSEGINNIQTTFNNKNIVINDITKVQSADFKGITFNNCTVHFYNFHHHSK